VGGAGVLAIRLAAAARNQGFECTAWVPGTGPASESLEAHHVQWRLYDLAGVRRGKLRHIAACASLGIRLLGSRRPIVHVHNPTVYRFLVPALRLARAHVVVHFHIEPTVEEIDWTLRFPPDHVVTCARYIKNQIDHRLSQDRIRTPVTAIPNAVDVERFSPGLRAVARQRARLDTANFALLMMANLAPHKGQLTAIRTVRELVDRGVPAECWLAGEDRSSHHEFEKDLRALASSLGVADRIRFLGFRDDVVDLLRAADVLLLPSKHEGLPLTVLEAQAVGIPVIGSTIPGILEVVSDDVTGMIAPADDYCGYSVKAEALYRRPELVRRLTAAASDAVRREYSWPTLERQAYAIYRSLDGSADVASASDATATGAGVG
jgi:glycosyltransferase involved in cell wall biosynthesis